MDRVGLKRVEATALKLTMQERARLAETLLLSLDAPVEVEDLRLWVVEAERRLRDLRTGKAKARSSSDALRRARAAISCER
ncbi:MAG: addiction module protein [Planctomycetes bacterium]|nr:addiction module protein [Planctomycetota bacterium]